MKEDMQEMKMMFNQIMSMPPVKAMQMHKQILNTAIRSKRRLGRR